MADREYAPKKCSLERMIFVFKLIFRESNNFYKSKT